MDGFDVAGAYSYDAWLCRCLLADFMRTRVNECGGNGDNFMIGCTHPTQLVDDFIYCAQIYEREIHQFATRYRVRMNWRLASDLDTIFRMEGRHRLFVWFGFMRLLAGRLAHDPVNLSRLAVSARKCANYFGKHDIYPAGGWSSFLSRYIY